MDGVCINLASLYKPGPMNFLLCELTAKVETASQVGNDRGLNAQCSEITTKFEND